MMVSSGKKPMSKEKAGDSMWQQLVKYYKTKCSRKLCISILLALASISAQAESLFTLKGKPQQGAMIIGKTLPGAQVYLDEKSLTVSALGDFVFAFGRDEEGSRTVKVVVPNGQAEQQQINIAKRDYQVQKITGIAKKYVEPDPEIVKRTRKEAALVKKARADKSDRLDFLRGFMIPVDGPVTGVYGSQRYFNGKPRRPHFGIDYAAPVGTPVHAPVSGRVTLVHNDMFYSGGTLIVDHGQGVSSTFIHLHKILVKVGDEVKQGQVIAQVGKSGRATGAHLDWRINWGDVRVDPQLVLDAFPATAEILTTKRHKSATLNKQ